MWCKMYHLTLNHLFRFTLGKMVTSDCIAVFPMRFVILNLFQNLFGKLKILYGVFRITEGEFNPESVEG